MRFFPENYVPFFGTLYVKNLELCQLHHIRNILKRKFLMFQFINRVNLLIQYYPFSKGKHGKESPFAAEHTQAGRFLLFQAMIGYIYFNHGACYIKQTEHRSQWPAA